MIIYLILTPFLFQTTLGYSVSQNSVVYLLCASSYLFANIILSRLINRFNIKCTMWLGITSFVIGSTFAIIPIYLQKLSSIELLLSGVFVFFGSGLMTPITYKQVLSASECFIGTSSSAINTSRVLIAFFFSLFSTMTFERNSSSLAFILGILCLACVGTYIFLSKASQYKTRTQPT